jgi:glycosidase
MISVPDPEVNMPTSIREQEVQDVIDAAKSAGTKAVEVDGHQATILRPFPSPEDWRDHWVYFLMVDRFNRPDRAPARMPYDVKTGDFQGGTIEGVRRRLGYLKELGAGAVWMTPVLKNAQFGDTFYGYGIQDFLSVDPRFASDPADAEGELQRMIDEAHARGLYVIFDIVLNHTGDVFEYVLDDGTRSSSADFRDHRYTVNWRKRGGRGNPAWAEAPEDDDPDLDPDAAVWPRELRANRNFRQQGKGGEEGGDFESLKELVTGSAEVRDALIRIHQYLIAKYDVDGFRIDTLKFIEEEFALTFGNAMREFALSIGKKNFFTFGEVFDDEEKIARFIGRRAVSSEDLIGVDAALDFPLFFKLPGAAKGRTPPSEVARVFERRKEVQRGHISSHGEAGRYFVTFLDNHDMKSRFYFRDPAEPEKFDDQVTLGLACLYTLQGIPCLYYGTEQGLSGSGGDTDQAVREALWGKDDAFDESHPFYVAVRELSRLRAEHPALLYGRQYFRPISGDGSTFGLSTFESGVLAFSRILNDEEVVVVANTHTESGRTLFVIVDSALNSIGSPYRVAFTNKSSSAEPEPVAERPQGVTIHEANGTTGGGPASVVKVRLAPMEAQILVRRHP